MIKLSLALSYVHAGWNRLAPNRHQMLMQGIALMSEYYQVQQEVGIPAERREASYNIGRLYHMLGLTNLAIPYYERCLDMQTDVVTSNDSQESFALEAALALRAIWTANGHWQKAADLTCRWLQM